MKISQRAFSLLPTNKALFFFFDHGFTFHPLFRPFHCWIQWSCFGSCSHQSKPSTKAGRTVTSTTAPNSFRHFSNATVGGRRGKQDVSGKKLLKYKTNVGQHLNDPHRKNWVCDTFLHCAVGTLDTHPCQTQYHHRRLHCHQALEVGGNRVNCGESQSEELTRVNK